MIIDKDQMINEINNGNISYREHSKNDLAIYKYTQNCVFAGNWSELTLMSRGLVLNSKMEVIANCVPKFFNYEDFKRYTNIDLDQPFTVTDKVDGSLIQVFMYNGNMIVSSSGAFENDYTLKAEELLNTKYEHLLPLIQTTDRVNFIFELVAPLTRVVITYGDLEELRLITVRNTDGTEDEDFVQQCRDLGFDYVKDLSFKNVDEIVAKKQGMFENIEGFVVKFADGSRIKFKYDEYFVLHKTITQVNKKFVWECMANGIEMNLDSIPDETYDLIKEWTKELEDAFDHIQKTVRAIYFGVTNQSFNDRREFAEHVQGQYPEYAKFMFALLDDHDINKMLWDYIKPKIAVKGM